MSHAFSQGKNCSRRDKEVSKGFPAHYIRNTPEGGYFITSFSKETDPYTPKHISPEWEGGWCMKP